MERNELSLNSKGGSELMQERLYTSLDQGLLDKFQIVLSRVRELRDDKYRIFWAHDVAGDPEATSALARMNWRRFHRLVFVSHSQMQEYCSTYMIPYHACSVIENGVTFDSSEEIKFQFGPSVNLGSSSGAPVKLIYHTTPHRGLNILVPVFKKLREKYNVELDVYSSFEIYGWKDADKNFEVLLNECKNTQGINYHGVVSNEEVREAVSKSHVFAYPSIWKETSCLALIEAGVSGLALVHPNLGALFDTSGGMSNMYQFVEDMNVHAGLFYNHLDQSIFEMIESSNNNDVSGIVERMRYFRKRFDWTKKVGEWSYLLKIIETVNPDKGIPLEIFDYKIYK